MSYYTVEELKELGCPNELIMQYIFLTKDEIYKMTGERLK